MDENSNNEEKVVIICRAPRDIEGGEYPISKIKNPHWSRISGGVHRRCGGYSLYGYIPYEDAMEIVTCSGRHDYMGGDAKICIVASDNKTGKYKEAYKELAAQAGEKPKVNRTRK